MNQKRLFNDGWQFAKSKLDVTEPAGLVYEPVELPHDWLIYNTLELYEDSIGWYRKTFHYTKDEQQLLLCFDGVYMDSSVYVNGQLVGEWKYGYSAFEHEITNAMVEGDNEILVKVVHQSPNSRWYSGAGIYRHVWLKTRDRNHIVTDGTYVSIQQQPDGWQVEVDTELNLEQNQQAELVHTIQYEGQVVASSQANVTASAVENAVAVTDSQQLIVVNPDLWSPDAPHLYELVTELRLTSDDQEHRTVESLSQRIGFRDIKLDANEGFHLNGVKMKLNGVCEHHDLGALGAAFNLTALRRRFVLLKEMGVNAIRTAHNMPAKEFMELADETGMLVVSEAFDMWERAKTPYDYARFFPEWVHSDVKSWVKRDRNHASLIMWSIGNEIYDTHADERGQEVTRMLMDYVLEFDPKGNAGVTIGSNYMPWENAQKCADIVKLAGYNYAEKYYDKHHEEHPDWIIYGSETSSVVQSRGIYHFPFEQPILADDDEQCSALGNSTTSWGAKSAEYCILAERDTPYSLGQFLWTGFDYIGEPTP
ncbi:glycoside hydrolase family 2 TIM barrel-domain containing protein, partial [Paenibacillus sp.]